MRPTVSPGFNAFGLTIGRVAAGAGVGPDFGVAPTTRAPAPAAPARRRTSRRDFIGGGSAPFQRFFPDRLELVAPGPARHLVGGGDPAAEEEGESGVLDRAREVVGVAVLVGGLVVGGLLVRLDLFPAEAGRLADDVGPEFQVRGGDAGLGEIELVGTVEPAAI